MDDFSASLILSLQIADIDAILRGSKGKNPEGRPLDAEIAMAAYREELSKNQTIIEDRRMGRSISEAVGRDGAIISTTREEEQVAIRDHELACRLGGIERPKLLMPKDLRETDVDDDFVNYLATLNVSAMEPYDEHESTGEGSSSTASFRTVSESGSTKQCVACLEYTPKHDTMVVPCTHTYCRHCVSTLFAAAITDESLFPPRCCRHAITVDSVQAFLDADLVTDFKAKAVELRTPNRTYCSRPTCSAFITPDRIFGELGVCLDCGQTTCTTCKTASHEGDCPNDTALQSLLDTATANGWQRCYDCRRLVELVVGCNHMTCLCSAQFCYECGRRWKNCDCPQWDENRLQLRAIQVVRRGNATGAANEQQQIQRAAEALRERHECDHRRWRRVEGPHLCEQCNHWMRTHIYECRQCQIQACNSCRRNRL